VIDAGRGDWRFPEDYKAGARSPAIVVDGDRHPADGHRGTLAVITRDSVHYPG
jgi:hypothetical protein